VDKYDLFSTAFYFAGKTQHLHSLFNHPQSVANTVQYGTENEAHNISARCCRILSSLHFIKTSSQINHEVVLEFNCGDGGAGVAVSG
jgi:hypothetical protein